MFHVLVIVELCFELIVMSAILFKKETDGLIRSLGLKAALAKTPLRKDVLC